MEEQIKKFVDDVKREVKDVNINYFSYTEWVDIYIFYKEKEIYNIHVEQDIQNTVCGRIRDTIYIDRLNTEIYVNWLCKVLSYIKLIIDTEYKLNSLKIDYKPSDEQMDFDIKLNKLT